MFSFPWPCFLYNKGANEIACPPAKRITAALRSTVWMALIFVYFFPFIHPSLSLVFILLQTYLFNHYVVLIGLSFLFPSFQGKNKRGLEKPPSEWDCMWRDVERVHRAKAALSSQPGQQAARDQQNWSKGVQAHLMDFKWLSPFIHPTIHLSINPSISPTMSPFIPSQQ